MKKDCCSIIFELLLNQQESHHYQKGQPVSEPIAAAVSILSSFQAEREADKGLWIRKAGTKWDREGDVRKEYNGHRVWGQHFGGLLHLGPRDSGFEPHRGCNYVISLDSPTTISVTRQSLICQSVKRSYIRYPLYLGRNILFAQPCRGKDGEWRCTSPSSIAQDFIKIRSIKVKEISHYSSAG